MTHIDIRWRCKRLGIINYTNTKFLLEYLLDHYIINQAQKEVLENIIKTIGDTCDSATEIIYYTQLNTLLDQYEAKLNCK